MVPSPATIMRLRYFVRVGVRIAGAVLVAFSMVLAAGVLLGFVSQFVSGQGIRLGFVLAGLLTVLGPGMVGLLLVALAPKVARWLVPIPTYRCPQCDYPLAGVTEGFCPECGLVLGEEVVEAGRRISAGPGRGG